MTIKDNTRHFILHLFGQLFRWLEEAPKGEAKYWIDKEEHDICDIDTFYDYLIALSEGKT